MACNVNINRRCEEFAFAGRANPLEADKRWCVVSVMSRRRSFDSAMLRSRGYSNASALTS